MRPVLVDLNSLYIFRVDISRNIRSSVHNKDLLALFDSFSGKYRAKEAGADNQIIVHFIFLSCNDSASLGNDEIRMESSLVIFTGSPAPPGSGQTP